MNVSAAASSAGKISSTSLTDQADERRLVGKNVGIRVSEAEIAAIALDSRVPRGSSKSEIVGRIA